MNKIKQILIPLFILLIASSCSTSNRINGSGYKTSNKVKKKDTERYFSRSSINESKSEEYSLSSANSTKTESTETFNEAHLTTSSDNTYSTIGNNSFSPNKRFSNNLKQEKKSLVNIKTNDEDKCDNIILRNGDEVKAKVIEVTETEVKYKRCDNLNGPI